MQSQKESTSRNQTPEDIQRHVAQVMANLKEQMDSDDYKEYLKYFRPKTEEELKMNFPQLAPEPTPQRSPRRAPKTLKIDSIGMSIPMELTAAEKASDLAEILLGLSKNDTTAQSNPARVTNIANASTDTVQLVGESRIDVPITNVDASKEHSCSEERKKTLRVRPSINKTLPPKKRAAMVSMLPRPTQQNKERAPVGNRAKTSFPIASRNGKRMSRSKNPTHDKYFRPHETKKRHVVCILCETEIWPPNRETHLKKCRKESLDQTK